MDDLWNILFTDAAFTCDKDSQVSRSHSDGCLQGPVKSGIIADDVVFVFKSLQFL